MPAAYESPRRRILTGIATEYAGVISRAAAVAIDAIRTNSDKAWRRNFWERGVIECVFPVRCRGGGVENCGQSSENI